MNSIKFRVSCAGIAFLSLAVIMSSAAVTVTDGLGRKVTLNKAPEKIVSTVPTNTETLYDLGLKDKVIAVTSHCAKTCDVTGKTVLGGWTDKDMAKKIEALKPDLVVAFGGLQKPLAAEMDKRKIAAFVFCPETVDETLEQILAVGELTGSSGTARDIVARCRENLKKIAGAYGDIPEEKRLKCLRLMSTNGMVIGGRSFQSDMVKRAGGINVFEDIDEAYPIVTLERVKAKDPDIIIFNRDDEKAAIDAFMKEPGWNDLRAAGNGRLMSISCDHICHPNTRIDKTVGMLARRFYPERFPAPERIVSLAPSITEELYLLGSGSRIVGVTTYCMRPDEAGQIEKVGTIKEANLEKIIDLKPDVVIATPLADPKAVESLRRLGIEVKIVPQPEDFAELCGQFIELGDIVGRGKEARDIAAAARERVKTVEEKAGTAARQRVFIQVGAKPLVAAGGCTFANSIIESAGGVNVAGDLSGVSYAPYSREKVIEADPDCIIIVNMGIAGEEERKAWEAFNNLKAVRNGRIAIVDSYRFCSPTPVTFYEMLEEIASILHPELFAEASA
ncbi:MAG: ABC transporter substrate-binding protein [Candidatus Omnitrophica bacterium]|nr:ABC transporter substrate-binding protein [Candidatus Omnitrophota bacterium]